MPPFYKIKHDWYIEDINFEKEQRKFFLDLIKKHPEEDVSNGFLEAVFLIDKKIKELRKKYKEIYGSYPPSK